MPVITPLRGASVLLSTTTLGVDGTFDVSNISQGFTDLVLMLIARGTDAGATDNLYLRFNNDSGANYAWQQTAYFGTTAAISDNASDTQIITAIAPAAGATASHFGMYQVTLTGYSSTSWVKRTMQPLTAYSGSGSAAAVANVGVWRSTAAINRIQILGGSTANLKTASVLRIYGVT